MLVGAFEVRRMEAARSGFSTGGGAGGGYDTGRGLRVEGFLPGGGGAEGLSRKEVLRATGALALGWSRVLRRSCAWTCISRSWSLADEPLLTGLSLDRSTTSGLLRWGGDGASTCILETVCEDLRRGGGLRSSLRRFPPSTYLTYTTS